MDGHAVVGWLRAQPDANAVEIVTHLLRVCDAGRYELRQRWSGRAFEPARRSVRDAVRATLSGVSSLRLDRPTLAAFANILDLGFTSLGVPYACHTVASVVDEVLGARFGEYFDEDDRSGRVLAVGDPFPIHPAPTLKILERREDSPGKPDNLTPPFVRTPRLGIVTDDRGMRIRMICLGSRLGHVNGETTIALVATNQSHAEFSATVYDDERRPFTSAAAWSGERGYFYDVRPGPFGADCEARRAAVEEQKRRIAAGIAAATGSQIALLPEFSSPRSSTSCVSSPRPCCSFPP